MNVSLQPSTVVVACKDNWVEAEVDDEIVALNVDHGMCYGMNRVSSHIWRLLAQPIKIGDLCSELLATYAVDAEVCERQVLELLEELQAAGLIAAARKA